MKLVVILINIGEIEWCQRILEVAREYSCGLHPGIMSKFNWLRPKRCRNFGAKSHILKTVNKKWGDDDVKVFFK